MSLVALVRRPGRNLQDGERTHVERTPIDPVLAAEQHARYVEALREAGARIVDVPVDPQLPDAVFIEDTALVLGSLAVIPHSAVETRRRETPAVASVLAEYCRLTSPPPGACFDGGDILAIDRTVYVGRGTRTNQAAIEFLTTILQPHGYDVVPVAVSGCLHLKTGVTYVGSNKVLINRQWVARTPFARYVQIEVDADEPMGANALLVGDALLMSASYPRTAKRVAAHGFTPRLIDISEFHRAEGGLTCLSILFSPAAPAAEA
jgi:dimethylargininase